MRASLRATDPDHDGPIDGRLGAANRSHRRGGAVPKIALVTGASSGIGLHTSAALAADGWTVVATARRPDASADLMALVGSTDGIDTLPLDVVDEASVAAAVDAVLAEH